MKAVNGFWMNTMCCSKFVPVWIDVVVAFVYAKTRKLDFGKRGFRGKRIS